MPTISVPELLVGMFIAFIVMGIVEKIVREVRAAHAKPYTPPGYGGPRHGQ